MKRISLLVLGVLCPLVACAGFKPVLPGGIVQTGGGLTLGSGSNQALPGNKLSPSVVYASGISSIHLNSNVISGGGTDDTVALQTVLDTAPALGSLELVIEKPALVSGLFVHSNTTIRFLEGSGLFLKAASNRPLIQNFNRSITVVGDYNIAIIGGLHNGNAANQTSQFETRSDSLTGAYATGFEFNGVQWLTIKNVELRDCLCMNLHCSNVQNVEMENIKCNAVLSGLGGINTIGFPSGVHFNGPSRYITVRNLWANVGDDILAINATDDNGIAQWGHGDITDVLIDGVIMRGSRQGIRLLSGLASDATLCRLDRITLRNISGDSYACGLQVNNWTNGGGSIGTLIIDGFSAGVTGDGYGGTQGGQNMSSFMQFGCPIDRLIVNNFVQPASHSDWPAICVDTQAVIGQMILSNAIFSNANAFVNTGAIAKLVVGVTNLESTAFSPTNIESLNVVMYSGTVTPVTPTDPGDWLAFYNFGDADPTSGLIDQSGTYSATPVDGSGLVTTTGKIGSAITFDGTGYYSAGSVIPNTPANFTVTGWFKTSAISGVVGRLITKGDPLGVDQFDLYFGAGDNQNGLQVYYSGNTGGPTYSSTALNDDAWHFFAVTYDAATFVLSLKVDGNPWIMVTGPVTMPTTTDPVFIGGSTNHPFDGSLDQVRFFNRILTNGEVSGLYGSGTGI